jgi:hypothetical protein
MSEQPNNPPTPADSAAPASAASAGATATAPAPQPQVHRGRRYGFSCSYCSSRLEAVESMAGQSGTCPTCGNSIVIPILDSRGRLIDPTSGKIIKQDPHPVHAYAAAGHKAPLIVAVGKDGEHFIQCPRCNRQNPLASNNCVGCGLPFTMEGTVGDSVSGTNTWAVASLVLGIVGIVGGFCVLIPPLLAVIFGMLALRTGNSATGKPPGQGLAIAGIILGTIGLLIFGVMIYFMHR